MPRTPASSLVTFPMFTPGDDPGPDFAELLRRVNPPGPAPSGVIAEALPSPTAPPCVAVRYADGVVMAGDRRATRGQPDQPPGDGEGRPGRPLSAASPSPAPPARRWRWSSCSSSSSSTTRRSRARRSASRARPTSSSMMVRGNLPAAMQGLVVVPLFAGYDLRRGSRPAVRSTTSPAAATRSATTSPPARAACTPAPSSSSATATASTATTPSTSPSRRCARPPTRTRPPAAPTSCAASTRSSPRSPPTGFERVDRRRDRRALPRPRRAAAATHRRRQPPTGRRPS